MDVKTARLPAAGFEVQHSRHIPDMASDVHVFRHQQTGMLHIHMDREDPEMGFLLSFPTAPTDDSGVAHALEHLTLCGSQAFPVRSPFFLMRRRSIATYSNAETAPDHTNYPFATTDAQDYWNMMSVYLDAAFFPLLDELDFRQEAVRLEPSTPDHPARFDGVVFNEMKGALSSRSPFKWRALLNSILPDTPFAKEHGGDPLAIPSLTPEALRQFHEDHYHPSRAMLLTYGAVDPLIVQEKLLEQVLDRHSWPISAAAPPRIEPTHWPAVSNSNVPVEGEVETGHAVIHAWSLLGTNEVECWMSNLVSLLISQEGQPLALALDGMGFGSREMVGMTRLDRVPVFLISMENLTKSQAVTVGSIINSALRQTAEAPIDQAQIDAMLDRVEQSQRNVTRSGGTPYGVARLGGVAEAWHRTGDPIKALDCVDLEKTLSDVRPRLTPENIQAWVRQNLVENDNRTRIEFSPDVEFFERREHLLAQMALQAESKLSHDQKQKLRSQAELLHGRQTTHIEPDVLPMLEIHDINRAPPPTTTVDFCPGSSHGPAIASIVVPYNGLLGQAISFDVSSLPVADRPWLDAFIDLWGEVGVGSMNWEQAARWRSSFGASVSLNLQGHALLNNRDAVCQELTFSASGLARSSAPAASAMVQSLCEVNFQDPERIRWFISQAYKNSRQGLSSQGGRIARLDAMSWLAPGQSWQQQVAGAPMLKFLGELNQQVGSAEGCAKIIDHLERIQAWILTQPCAVRAYSADNSHSAAEHLASLLPSTVTGWSHLLRTGSASEALPAPAQAAYVGQVSVNTINQVFRAARLEDQDASACAVLGDLITDRFLHPAIREQGGAYGAGLSWSDGAFVFGSFRDPRLAGTLLDFGRAREWVLDGGLSPQAIKEAVLSTIAKLSAPDTPGETASRSWSRQLAGTSEEIRLRFREGILDVTATQLRSAAAKWLDPSSPSSRTAFIGRASIGEAQGLGLVTMELADLLDPPSARKPLKL
jgi:Zn-dependent M16 (insulinase) family peptidase